MSGDVVQKAGDRIREFAAEDGDLDWSGAPQVARHADEIAAYLFEHGLLRPDAAS